MMDTRIYYEKTQTVFMRDCDMFKRLKPSAILTMFQDCSEDLTEGWGVGLDVMLEQGFIWVVAKVACQVERLPEHGDVVHIRGWARRNRLGLFPYHIDIMDEAGETLISGDTMWVLSDVEQHTMLSARVPQVVLPSPEGPGERLPHMAHIQTPETFQRSSRRAMYSEMDINGHLTNNKYMDWVCDLADPAFHAQHPMKGMRIDYHAEILAGEEVSLEWDLTDQHLWCRSADRFEAMISF